MQWLLALLRKHWITWDNRSLSFPTKEHFCRDVFFVELLCPHSLECCSPFCFMCFWFPPAILDASFLSPQTSRFNNFTLVCLGNLWLGLKAELALWKRIISACELYRVRYTDTTSLFSVSVGNTLHMNLGNCQYMRRKHHLSFSSIICIFMFCGNIVF